MSSNLLKLRSTEVQSNNARVIDTNYLVAKRLESLNNQLQKKEDKKGGFEKGIAAENIEIEALFQDTEAEVVQSNVIKAPDPEELNRKALEEANAMLAETQSKIDQMLADAKVECQKALEEAKEKGLAEGRAMAQAELQQERARIKEKEEALEAEYSEMIDQLEPQFIENLTSIYEHVFRVDFSTNREVLEYLISAAMRKVENSRSFLLHVSKDDYPYISMRKQQILGGTVYGDATMEIIEDITLARNECMIETDNGIFDCSLGTQLSELSKKLKLLAYQGR